MSTSDIAKALALDPTQVRKDLAYTGAKGRPRVGYELEALIVQLERFLGWDNKSEAFLVGAGYLGSALLGYHGFQARGLHLVAAFDTDPNRVGSVVHGVEIFHISRLVSLAQRLHVHIGVLTVPAAAAQACAETMVEGGILAIWNFAPTQLSLPEQIIVENEHLDESLAVLSRRLFNALQTRRGAGLGQD